MMASLSKDDKSGAAPLHAPVAQIIDRTTPVNNGDATQEHDSEEVEVGEKDEMDDLELDAPPKKKGRGGRREDGLGNTLGGRPKKSSKLENAAVGLQSIFSCFSSASQIASADRKKRARKDEHESPPAHQATIALTGESAPYTVNPVTGFSPPLKTLAEEAPAPLADEAPTDVTDNTHTRPEPAAAPEGAAALPAVAGLALAEIENRLAEVSKSVSRFIVQRVEQATRLAIERVDAAATSGSGEVVSEIDAARDKAATKLAEMQNLL